jgi:hypothetical protein
VLPELAFFVELERQVWEALLSGDAEADARALSADFLGVYDTGLSDRAEHAAQLAHGPLIVDYLIDRERLLPLAADTALLAYRARFRRHGEDRRAPVHTMFVSSIWQRRDGGWVNVFSQDTPERD